MARFVRLFVCAVCVTMAMPRAARADTVRVVVPEADNLQYMAFWVATQRGFFHDEGVDVVVSVAANPRATLGALRAGRAEVAVLEAPMALELASSRFGFVVVANLMQNDPANLVVSAGSARDRKLGPELGVGERLANMKGLRVGVAPGPKARLRAVLQASGIDEGSLSIQTVASEAQVDALKDGKVDALFTHTPFLETAIVDQGAVVAVNASSGEVAPLANIEFEMLAVTRKLADAAPDAVTRLVSAIARAERSIHEDEKGTVDALCAEFPRRDRPKVQAVVHLYTPAVPLVPNVSTQGLQAAVALFPAHREAPDLTGIELGDYVDSSFASGQPRVDRGAATGSRAWLWYAIAALAAVVTALVFRSKGRTKRQS